jgi:hypothetical protein
LKKLEDELAVFGVEEPSSLLPQQQQSSELKVIKPGDGVLNNNQSSSSAPFQIPKKQAPKSTNKNKRRAKKTRRALDYMDRTQTVEMKKWQKKVKDMA